MIFIKLTSIDGSTCYFNASLIEHISKNNTEKTAPTYVTMTASLDGNYYSVLETPEEIFALISHQEKIERQSREKEN